MHVTETDLLEITTQVNELNRENGPVILAINYFLLFVSVVIVACDIFAVCVLTKCRRIPRQCLYYSISFISSDAVNSVFFSLFQMCIYWFQYHTIIVHYSRIFTIGIMNNISSASMGALMLERIIALNSGMKYRKIMKGACVKFGIIMLWILHTAIVVASLAVGVWNHCNWQLHECDFFDASRIARFTVIGVMIFYDIVLVTSYISICRIARRHISNIIAMKRLSFSNTVSDTDNISDRQYATTQAIIYVVIAFLILQAPINVHIIVSETSDTIRHELVMRVFLGISYLCLQAHSFVNLYLYVGKFKECKMVFYFVLGRFFKSFETRAETLRIDVFDIVVSSEVPKPTLASHKY